MEKRVVIVFIVLTLVLILSSFAFSQEESEKTFEIRMDDETVNVPEGYKYTKGTFSVTLTDEKSKGAPNYVKVDNDLSMFIDSIVNTENSFVVKFKEEMNGKKEIVIPKLNSVTLTSLESLPGGGIQIRMVYTNKAYIKYGEESEKKKSEGKDNQLVLMNILEKYKNEWAQNDNFVYILSETKNLFLINPEDRLESLSSQSLYKIIDNIKTPLGSLAVVKVSGEGDTVELQVIDAPDGVKIGYQGDNKADFQVEGYGGKKPLKIIISERNLKESTNSKFDDIHNNIEKLKKELEKLQNEASEQKSKLLDRIGGVSPLRVAESDKKVLDKLKMEFLVATDGPHRGKIIIFDEISNKVLIQTSGGVFKTLEADGNFGVVISGPETKQVISILKDYEIEGGRLINIRPPEIKPPSINTVNRRLSDQIDYANVKFKEEESPMEVVYTQSIGSKEYQVYRSEDGGGFVLGKGQRYAFVYEQDKEKWMHLDLIKGKATYLPLELDKLSYDEKRVIASFNSFKLPDFRKLGYRLGIEDLDAARSIVKREIKDRGGNVVGYYVSDMSRGRVIELDDKVIELGNSD